MALRQPKRIFCQRTTPRQHHIQRFLERQRAPGAHLRMGAPQGVHPEVRSTIPTSGSAVRSIMIPECSQPSPSTSSRRSFSVTAVDARHEPPVAPCAPAGMCLLLALHIVLLLAPVPPATALPSTITIGLLLHQFDRSAHSLLDSAQNTADNVVNNAVYSLINTIQQIREQYKDSLDYTLAQLSTHEHDLLVGIEQRIDQLFSHIQHEHDRIDETLDNFAIYLSDFVFVDNVPRVSRFLTSTAVHGRLADTPLLIRFRGKNLNHPSNRLVVSVGDGDFELKPVEMSDNQISFSLAQQIAYFTSPRTITLLPVELSLFEDVFLFSPKERKYRYLVRVLPSELARVVFHYTETVPVVVERIQREIGGPTGFFYSPNLFSSRTKKVSMTHPPDEGYKIDTQTVSASWKGSSACWSRRSRCTAGATEVAAKAECTIVSEKGFAGLFEGCSYETSLRFIQYKVVDEVRSHQTESFTWIYGKPIAWQVPSGKHFTRVEVRLFDGTTALHNTGDRTPLMRVGFDQRAQTVTVSRNVDFRAFR